MTIEEGIGDRDGPGGPRMERVAESGDFESVVFVHGEPPPRSNHVVVDKAYGARGAFFRFEGLSDREGVPIVWTLSEPFATKAEAKENARRWAALHGIAQVHLAPDW